MNLDLELHCMPLGDMQTNCYILTDKSMGEAYVFDPGSEAYRVIDFLKDINCTLYGIVLTHGHFDHILGVDDLLKEYPGIPVYASYKEQPVFKTPSYNLCSMVGGSFEFKPTDYLQDGDIIYLCNTAVKCLHTPGHTCGGMSYFIEDKYWLICGDTLFQGSIGRTDFPSGSFKVISNSIKNKIYTLPDWTKVFPGHGPSTTVEQEKRCNMFVRPDSEE